MSLDWPANPLAVALSYAQHALWLLSLAAALLLGRKAVWWAAFAAFALLAAWMTRGWIGELSLLHSLWSLSVVVVAFFHQQSRRMPPSVAGAIAVLGLLLYPSALHLVAFDVYALGYFAPLSVAFVVLAGLAWWRCQRLWAWGIVAGVALWALGFRYSPNLWDMLLDVPLWISAICALIALAIKRARQK